MTQQELDQDVERLAKAAKLESWHEFVEDLAVPSELYPALVTNRTELLRLGVGGVMKEPLNHGPMIWSDTGITECPGCGATVTVGVMSLCATCKIDGYYYVNVDEWRGWYSSREAYERGDPPVRGWQ